MTTNKLLGAAVRETQATDTTYSSWEQAKAQLAKHGWQIAWKSPEVKWAGVYSGEQKTENYEGRLVEQKDGLIRFHADV